MDEIETKHGNFERKEAFVPGDGPNGARVYTINTYVTIVMIDDGSKSGDVDDAAVKKQIKVRLPRQPYSAPAAAGGCRPASRRAGVAHGGRAVQPGALERAVGSVACSRQAAWYQA